THHLLRGARGDVELLASVVADAGMAELDDAISDGERRERVADGHFQRSPSARAANQEPVEQQPGFAPQDLLALVRRRRLERPRDRGDRVEWVGGPGATFAHATSVPPPSDIPRRRED